MCPGPNLDAKNVTLSGAQFLYFKVFFTSLIFIMENFKHTYK